MKYVKEVKVPPRMFNIYPVMYVDFNRTTYGHEGTWRDNFSLKDLQEFLDFLHYREMAYTEQIIFKCRGRAMGTLKIHDFGGSPGNLMRFESSDPVNDPAILVFKDVLQGRTTYQDTDGASTKWQDTDGATTIYQDGG